jgi:ferritin-like metal-binding protein YciE
MTTKTLNDLFRNQLQVLYGAEKESKTTLAQMARAANSPALRTEFNNSVNESETRVKRLEEVFKLIGEKPTVKACKGFGGILENCKTVATQSTDPHVRDAAMIAVAQGFDHHEIASYDSARIWAKTLKQEKASELLQKAFNEEVASNKRLADLATTINPAALQHAHA